MLLLLSRKCCDILWKRPSYYQYFTMSLFLLVLLIQQQQQAIESKPTEWNHGTQRRFMWKQMDSTVDGIIDHVVTGARVMKSMIGDFMPLKQAGANAIDYLPTETTRIKYIIRNPHTKETRVIRIRPSKKVIKLMAMTPKPLITEKPKLMHMFDPVKLRQIEKEQELIAEGHTPKKNEENSNYMKLRPEKQKNVKDDNEYSLENDEIVSGRTKEFNESWNPVYKLGDTPNGFTTSKPYMMSPLHTSVVGELPPESQKPMYEPLVYNNFPKEEPKKTHTYEVTEYAAEESVVQPYTHEYNHLQTQPILSPSLARGSSIKYSTLAIENPNIITQIENETTMKPQKSEYRHQRGFLPSRGTYRSNEETSTTTTTTTSTTTTTEGPNYPAIFLRKYRNRPNSVYNLKEQLRSKSPEFSLDDSWMISNNTSSNQRNKYISYHQNFNSFNATQRTKSQKWQPDFEDIHLNAPSSLSQYEVSSATEAPYLEDLTTQSIHHSNNSRKNVRLKTQRYPLATETKYRSIRQRGSIKYGDKLDIEER